MIDRRRHNRLDVGREVTVEILGEDRSVVATLVNLGPGGARVDLPFEVMIPSSLRLTLPDLNDEVRGFDLAATVAWTVTDRDGGPYPTGLQFSELDSRQAQSLARYLEALAAR